jgi:hypothetical protein
MGGSWVYSVQRRGTIKKEWQRKMVVLDSGGGGDIWFLS